MTGSTRAMSNAGADACAGAGAGLSDADSRMMPVIIWIWLAELSELEEAQTANLVPAALLLAT